jgi:hypothetical protein
MFHGTNPAERTPGVYSLQRSDVTGHVRLGRLSGVENPGVASTFWASIAVLSVTEYLARAFQTMEHVRYGSGSHYSDE